MPESEVILDGGHKAIRVQGGDPSQPMALIYPLDQSIGVQSPQRRIPGDLGWRIQDSCAGGVDVSTTIYYI